MTSALSILSHAIAMIFRDPGATLRTIAPGTLIILVASGALFFAGPDLVDIDPETGQPVPATISAGAALTFLLGVFVAFFGLCVMVVSWHRYVLLQGNERDSGMTPSVGIVGRYLGKSILLALLMVPLLFVLGAVTGGLAASSGFGAGVVVQFIAGFGIGWLVMRLSLVLPAISIGKQMGFGESWRVTTPEAVTILWIVLGLSVINLIAQFIGIALVPAPIVSFVAQAVMSLFTTLVGVSALSTLYGVLVEGRSLDP